MKISNWLVPLFLSLSFVFLFRHFFGEKFLPKKDNKISSGESYTAPLKNIQEEELRREVHRPLNIEVDFLDKDLSEDNSDNKIIKTEVNTDYAKYIFTTDGASLESAEFRHNLNNNSKKVTWLEFIKSKAKEDKCFLLALDSKTPVNYKLINNNLDNKNKNITKLIYQANSDLGIVTKEYLIYKNLNKIDLNLTFEPSNISSDNINKKDTNSTRLRLFLPAPAMLGSQDYVKGIYNKNNEIEKRGRDKLVGSYWSMPNLFGTESHYFVNSLIGDNNNFVKRGYYNFLGLSSAVTILESAKISKKTSFKLSFYVGSKQLKLLTAVEPKLEYLLEYGFFGALTKVFFNILNYLNNYLKSFGWAIILLTLLLKLLLIPFTHKAEINKLDTKKDKEHQRKMQYLQQKYQNDREGLARAQSELMRKQTMSGLPGCLPLFLQIPIFISLRSILNNAIELYEAPFLWIPNLAAPDPYYVLPILLGLSMFLMMLKAKGGDSKQTVVAVCLGLLGFGFMSGFSAGLVLFFFMNSGLDIVKTKIYRIIFKNKIRA